MASNSVLPDYYFDKQDPSRDELFYSVPRKVVHIDNGAIEALRAYLATVFKPVTKESISILDLMSSWRSHLPNDLDAQVVGLGMNGDEMADNPQLNTHVVQNLNQNPLLPFEDQTFDGAICTVSVQYLTRPLEVFNEVQRVLKPGAPFIVSFSNRCFPTKAVAVWLANDDEGHIELVKRYFESDGWSSIDVQRLAGGNGWRRGDPLYIVRADRLSG